MEKGRERKKKRGGGRKKALPSHGLLEERRGSHISISAFP